MFWKTRITLTLYNIGVIGAILSLIALVIFMKSQNFLYHAENKIEDPVTFFHRSFMIILTSLILIFLGGWFISGKALVPIKKAWQKQMDFTADASHELRTPLAVIQTNLELIMGNPEETVESQTKWLENILIENKRMTKLVEDLLTLSRADANQQTLDVSSFRIDKVLDQAAESFKPLAKNKFITLNIDTNKKISFIGDQSRMYQLIVILLDNAIKYTDAGGKVTLALKQKEKSVVILISDTGEGIESEHLTKIFDRFYRVDKARARNIGGSGLGLSIAKWIVEAHHGSIDVRSYPDQGTHFTITLPYGQ